MSVLPTTSGTSSLPQPGVASTCVFVVDATNAQLMPCSPKRAARLLDSKKAVVFQMNLTAPHTRFTRLQRFDGYTYSRESVE